MLITLFDNCFGVKLSIEESSKIRFMQNYSYGEEEDNKQNNKKNSSVMKNWSMLA